MKTSELRSKSADELKAQLLDLSKAQFNFRFQKSTGQLEKTGGVRETRRTIAKIKTILAELKSGKAPVAKKAPKAKVAASKEAAPKKKKESKE
jgi:large subunit ribosomal protein L29